MPVMKKTKAKAAPPSAWVLSARPHRRHGTTINCPASQLPPYKPFRFASLQSPSASASGHHHYHDPAPFPTPGHAPLPQRAGSPDAMDLDADMIPTSPSADSSPSSSDLDTEVSVTHRPASSCIVCSWLALAAWSSRIHLASGHGVDNVLASCVVAGSRRGPSSRTGARRWGR